MPPLRPPTNNERSSNMLWSSSRSGSAGKVAAEPGLGRDELSPALASAAGLADAAVGRAVGLAEALARDELGLVALADVLAARLGRVDRARAGHHGGGSSGAHVAGCRGCDRSGDGRRRGSSSSRSRCSPGSAVAKAAARLSGCVANSQAGADANRRVAGDSGAAGGLGAVGSAPAGAGDELLSGAVADVFGSGGVGSDGLGRCDGKGDDFYFIFRLASPLFW